MEDGSSSSGMAGARRGGVRGWLRPGRGWLAEISDAVVSVFFPSGCRICERLLTSASRVPVCEECLSSFKRVPNIVWEVCGLPLPEWTQKRGAAALSGLPGQNLCLEDAVVRAILLLKFKQIAPLGV